MKAKAAMLLAALVLGVLLFPSCGTDQQSAAQTLREPATEADLPTPSYSLAPTPSPTLAPTPSPTKAGEASSTYLPEVPRISVAEVKARLDVASNIVIIDVRPTNEYERSHIAGSISVPVTDMAGPPYADLDQNDEIALYCT